MRFAPLLLAASLAFVTLSFAAPSADAIGCIEGTDQEKCLVSVTTVYCFTEPCDGLIVCLDHGLVCTNDL